MGNADLMVDGNALAGVLGEVFAHEMTSARIACEGCDHVEPIGAQHAYMHAPGVVLRCCHWQAVLLVIAQQKGRHLVGFVQTKWFEVSDESGIP